MALNLTPTLETEEEGAPAAPEPAAEQKAPETDLAGMLAAASPADLERVRLLLGVAPGQATAPPGVTVPAGALLVDPRTLPPLGPEPTPTGEEAFTVHLPSRFALYLRHRSAAHGESPEVHLAGILRHFWKDDLWRQTSTAPTGPGQPAGTSRR